MADDYDRILAAARIEPPVRTVRAHGERLTETFGVERFDIVHCGNALDHHYDPIAALEGMLAVAKPNGLVVLNHYVDEGEFQNYLGMHQWNINQRDGHMLIWNMSHHHDIDELLAGRARVRVSLRQSGSRRERLETMIRKDPVHPPADVDVRASGNPPDRRP